MRVIVCIILDLCRETSLFHWEHLPALFALHCNLWPGSAHVTSDAWLWHLLRHNLTLTLVTVTLQSHQGVVEVQNIFRLSVISQLLSTIANTIVFGQGKVAVGQVMIRWRSGVSQGSKSQNFSYKSLTKFVFGLVVSMSPEFEKSEEWMIRCKPGSISHSHGWLTEGGQQQAGAGVTIRAS